MVPLGYTETASSFLSQKEIFEIECRVFEELKGGVDDDWSEIFKRNKQLFLIDKLVLQSAKKLSISWRFRYLMICLFRLAHTIVDMLNILLNTPPTYFLKLKKSGNKTSKKIIIVYTNNRSRSDIFNIDNRYCQYDVLITLSDIDGYKLLTSTTLDFKTKLSCLKLKFRFPYISSDVIFKVMASKILFTRGFEKLLDIRESAGVFSREGTTNLAKMFLYTAGKAGFLRNVIYNLPAITPNVLFPRECENLVLISDALPYYAHENINTIVLRDNPYLQWREVAGLLPAKKAIGLLLGDDMNRWVEQEILDHAILDELKSIGCSLCLGRPHPQELTRPKRVSYYKDLVKQYPFLQLELGESEKFLTDISLLIVYTKSTMVQESMLCKRPVIEYRSDCNYSPNESILNISNNLGVSISDIQHLGPEIDENLSQNKTQRHIIWEGFLKNLKISAASRVNVAEVFDNKLINS